MLNFKPDWTVATGSETFKYYAAANPVSRALMPFLQGAPISSFDAFSMVYSTYRMLCSSRPKNLVFHIIAQFYNMKRLAIPSGMHKKCLMQWQVELTFELSDAWLASLWCMAKKASIFLGSGMDTLERDNGMNLV